MISTHNPGNIEAGAPWQGLDDPPSDGRFARFKSPTWGIRAIARTLITYQDNRRSIDGSKIDTAREIIERWAPPSENDTSAYVQHVRGVLGLTPGQELDAHRYEIMRPLVETIILHENGVQPYSDAQIDKGLLMAGIEPPAKSLQDSRTIRGGQVASLGVAGSALSEAAAQVSVLADYSDYFKWAFIALTIGGIALTIWARIDDRNKGLR